MPIDAGVQAFLDEWNAAWAALPAQAGHAERRFLFETIARRHRQPDPPGVVVGECYVPHSAQRIRVRTFQPQGVTPERPAVVFMHGGAWMEGSPETHWDTAMTLASRLGACVFSVDYALTPEHPFPCAHDQCVAVTHWVLDESESLGVDPSRVSVWGDSAGGNLAAAVALALRDAKRSLCAQVLFYPAVAFDKDRPSYRENAHGPVVQVAHMAYVDGLYCRRPEDQRDPRAAPLLARSHADLAPAYIGVAEFDPLRDDGLVYAQALRAAGVPVQLHEGRGLTHAYLRAVPWSAVARAAQDVAMDWLNNRFAAESLEEPVNTV